MAGQPSVDVTMPAPQMPTETPELDRRARDIRISEIAVYQPVKVSLVKDGQSVVERNAPVIVDKQAFLRISVEPLSGFRPREIEAQLELSTAEEASEPITVTQMISGPSEDSELDSTLNIDIPAEAMEPGLRYAVTLNEVDTPADGTVDPSSRYPESELTVALLGSRSAGPLRVMIVPYRYTADGSNRLPELSDEQLELYKSELYDRYPVSEIEFVMHDPVDYPRAVNPTTGWEAWLDYHCRLRADENTDPKLLYYGLMSPRDSLRRYGGGIIGVSYLPGPSMNFGRCSVGVGFPGRIASTTMAHELGHSLGLPHAPCGVDGPAFPYEGAKVGVWGYNRNAQPGREMVDPDDAFDLMSYCDPNFISDYNFQKLFERVRYLNLQFSRTDGGEAQELIQVMQFADGHYEITGRVTFTADPGDEQAQTLAFRDAAGQPLGEAKGYFLPASLEGAGMWFVPDIGAASVILEGETEVLLP